jgi:putative membrane-bound dehydrogenase-like protein
MLHASRRWVLENMVQIEHDAQASAYKPHGSREIRPLGKHHGYTRWRFVLVFSVNLFCCLLSTAVAQSPAETTAESSAAAGLRAPEGFEVTLFADDDLAHDIFSMTLDSEGRVVVAGRGYVKTLHDDNDDGRADRATLFSEIPASGAHGLCFDGPHLLCTGDKALMRLKDDNGDGAADGKPEIWATLNHAEHGANGVTRGPDGAFYVACGNDAGVTATLASDERSPVQKPNCGAMLRFEADGSKSQILAHGFRNPYDLDFNSAGQLFTVDADGERDQFLPWYTPTRLFDVAIGMHHGWVLQGWQHSWNRPEEFFDNVSRLVEIGRGSPTGLIVYRHTNFPKEYRDNVLSCCWTLGRVYRFPLKPHGSSYQSQTEIFLETTGEVGFAPVDLAVGKSGELYVAIGGRGTRGGVFCVKYVGPPDAPPKPMEPPDFMTQVLQAPQPLAAWSRNQWLPVAKKLGAEAFLNAANDTSRPVTERIRAVEVLTDVFEGLSADQAHELWEEETPQLTARGCWSLSIKPSIGSKDRIKTFAHADDLVIARAAWEGLLSIHQEHEFSTVNPRWKSRRVRAEMLLNMPRNKKDTQSIQPFEQAFAALWASHFSQGLQRADFITAARAFQESQTDSQRLEAIRLMQLTLGDVPADAPVPIAFAGYTSRDQKECTEAEQQIIEELVRDFSVGTSNVDYEMARLLAMLRADSPKLPAKLANKWTGSKRLESDLHYLIALALCPGQRSEEVTKQTATALANLHFKLAKGQMTPSRNWPQRVNEMLAELMKRDPNLAAALVAEPKFRLPTQSLFALQLPQEQKLAAARKFLKLITSDAATDVLGDDAHLDEVATRWTAELVELVAQLPPRESLPALRDQWEDFLLRDDLALVLAKQRDAADRQRLLEALSSVQPHVVESVAKALTELPAPEANDNAIAGAELLPIFTALRQACLSPASGSVRQALGNLLTVWTGEKTEVAELTPDGEKLPEAAQQQAILTGYAPRFDWFAKNHPEAAAKLTSLGGETGAEWAKRLETIDWDAADVVRGKLVFEKRSCAKCHSGQNRLGPDLAGAAGRFARGDLLAAIIDPSRDVSPLYQTTQIVTGGGKVYQGLIVYESPEGTLLQTTPETTIRIAGEEILAMRKSRQSLMPTGLLNGATDADLADLLAYLKTLTRAQ